MRLIQLLTKGIWVNAREPVRVCYLYCIFVWSRYTPLSCCAWVNLNKTGCCFCPMVLFTHSINPLRAGLLSQFIHTIVLRKKAWLHRTHRVSWWWIGTSQRPAITTAIIVLPNGICLLNVRLCIFLSGWSTSFRRLHAYLPSSTNSIQANLMRCVWISWVVRPSCMPKLCNTWFKPPKVWACRCPRLPMAVCSMHSGWTWLLPIWTP